MEDLFKDLLGQSFTSNITYWASYYKIEDDKDYCLIEIPAPGIDKEDIEVKVINKTVNLVIPEGDFTKETTFSWDFDYKIKPDKTKSFYEDGVINILITKPKNTEFNVEVE
jgi:HSP20 family molecular chaperone IbpA